MPFNMLPGAADRAVALMDYLAAHRWAQACSDFDATMVMRLDAAGVEEAWAQVTNRLGRYEETGVPRVGPIGDYTVVDVPLTFEAGRMIAGSAMTAAARSLGCSSSMRARLTRAARHPINERRPPSTPCLPRRPRPAALPSGRR